MLDRHQKSERIKSYANRILPVGEAAAAATEFESFEALPGARPSGDDELDERKARTIRKLARGEELDREEEFTFEAIIAPEERPVAAIVNDDFDPLPPPWAHYSEDETAARIKGAIPSIGRIESDQYRRVSHLGTAFVVGPDLMMTNRHVAALFAQGLGLRDLRFAWGRTARVDFKAEHDSNLEIEFNVREIAMIHPYWDMALLRVEGLSDAQRPLRLSVLHPDDLKNREVAVIGYPAFDRRNDADVQNEVFGGEYNIKRLQPGIVLGRRETPTYPSGWKVEALTHDSSTLGGNSGSCVFDVTTGEVVALHFGGRYLDANFAVPSWELARDGRVSSSGVHFAGSVDNAAPIEWEQRWRDADRTGESPLRTPSSATTRARTGTTAAPRRVASGSATTVTIPIHVTIEVGDAPTTAAVQSVADARGAAEEAIHQDLDYGNRDGYEPDFLGGQHRIPLPALAEDLLPLVALNREETHDPFVLPYHHFSVIMNRERGIAFVTAANIDGKRHRNIKRETDRWFADPRIGEDEQIQNDAYADTENEENPLDRGHLVRRLDPTWGSAAQAKAANDDTFHWTNCSPQHKGFNRNRTTWGGVENHILKQARDEDKRLTVFTGPIFRDTDWDLTLENGTRVIIPDEYWKVVAMIRADGGLSATGYVISQQRHLDDWLEATFTAETFQRPIRQIEAETGISFHDLRDHDPLESDTESLALEGRRLGSFDDIVV